MTHGERDNVLRNVWRYQRVNQKPQVEDGETIQSPKDVKWQKETNSQ